MTTRYYAIHNNAKLDLHGWDERRVEDHRRKDFKAGHTVHVIDSHTCHCVACGMSEPFIMATRAIICPGPPMQASISGGVVGDADARKNLQDMIEKYKTIPPPSEQAAPPKDEKLIAESVKPTTGVDWDAFKNFGKGL